jgi:hypothetical protein
MFAAAYRDFLSSSPCVFRHCAARSSNDFLVTPGFGVSITGRYQKPAPFRDAANLAGPTIT